MEMTIVEAIQTRARSNTNYNIALESVENHLN